MAYWAVD